MLSLVAVACNAPPGALSAPEDAPAAPADSSSVAPADAPFAPPDAGSPCTLGDVQTIPMPGTTEAGAHTLVSDGRGYVLLWGTEYGNDPTSAGLFAMRAGGEVKHLVPGDRLSLQIAAVATPSGFLICYTGNAGPTCLMVDANLNVTQAPAASPFGSVDRFVTDGSSISALASTVDSTGQRGPLTLIPVDPATGGAAGDPAPLPCTTSANHVAITSDAIACLVPSDPACGSQFYTGVCTNGLELYARDGTPIASHPAIAPFGGYGSQLNVQLAARDDGFLIAWQENDGLHIVHAALDGTTAAPPIIPNIKLGTLAAVPGGYIALTEATYPDVPGDFHLPQIVALAPDGSLAHAPVWLATPPQPFRLHDASEASVATRDGGFAVAWRSTNGLDGNDARAALQLRQVGCDVGALPDVTQSPPACPSDPPPSTTAGTCPPPPPAPDDCANEGGAGCFVLPSAALTVAGGTPAVSCGPEGPPGQLFIHPVTVSGTIHDAAGTAVPGATVEEFNEAGFIAPTVATTADASGAYSITLPPDTSDYPLWRTRGDGLLDTIEWHGARIDPSQTSVSGIDLLAFPRTTAASWAAAAGTSFADCDTLLLFRVVDCQGRPMAHAIVTLTAGKDYDACPAFIPGTRVVYLGSDGAPAARSALAETGTSGKTAIFGAPRAIFSVQVYGYLSDADRAAGKLTLIGYSTLLGRGNAVQFTDLPSAFGPFP